ncbi:MAG: DNA primase [Bacteroidetes bacterium CG18_big_fil_WC_8_21_14_2_50_41_14]|nr:MAG: DNA primase [Bacteroidetes bacterium CG18_big_fil_WC_8_21_14_2_50_41_14]PJB59916.1 MAG: DUF349 domain-containing protein [Bacteroidetes bacterium CG_4_9_14_3_um_filter_41_19]
METKIQPDQNPEGLQTTESQEDMSLSTPVVVDDIKNSQISPEEKQWISEALTIDHPSPVSTSPVETATPPEPKEVHHQGPQISGSERRIIVRLLRGNSAAVEEYLDYTSEEINYNDLNKQELVDLLEDAVQEGDFEVVKSQVTKINAALRKIVKEEHDKERHEFVTNGGKEEEFVPVEDSLDIRFREAFNQYKQNKARHSEEVEKVKVLNLQRKLDLLEELKVLINSEETLKKTYDEFKNLQDTWKEIGMVPAAELRNLWQNYHFLVEKFFDKVRINKELRDLDMKKNMEQKIELCEKAEELLMEKSIIKSFKLLQHYHEKWREVGPVPSDVKEDIWERFKGASDKINQRRKDHYKELQGQQQSNFNAKKALIEKAEEILAITPESLKDWQSKTDQVNELVRMWKSIGRAPNEHNDEVWQQFREKLDGFFTARRNYLNELKDQQINNYNLKLDLCVRAESFAESEDWKEITRELINLQKEWKKIGPVPRKHSDKIWKRFRSACDQFFERKSSHFKNQHGFEEENLKKKQELVAKIVGFEMQNQKSADMEALNGFQREWVEIGHVPFQMKDKIQHEYREAIDNLMNKMHLSKSEAIVTDFKTRVESLKTGPESDRKLYQERNALAIKMKRIQDDVMLWENNIGFFSNSKQANKLKMEFENKIERAKQELAVMKEQLRLLN